MTIKRYPICQSKQTNNWYTPSFENEDFHDVTANINVDDTKINSMSKDAAVEYMVEYIMIQQYNLKKGLRIFVERVKKAVKTESTQLHEMETFIPIDTNKITKTYRMEAPFLLVVLLKKRDFRIKIRACSDGSKNIRYMKKEDAASPIVAQESVMTTESIEAHKIRDV